MSTDVKQVMRDYFLDLDDASRSPTRKVAWCTSVGPAEILRAAGFELYFPENHGALLGASRASASAIPVANAAGYSPDICSYLTSDIGAHLSHRTPLAEAYGVREIPRPDLLVYDTNQCKDVMHWFEYYSREFRVPIHGIHSPGHLARVTDENVEDVVAQLRRLVKVAESVTGSTLDPAALKRVVTLSREATELWGRVLRSAKARPSPLTFFDATIQMGPVVVLRGTEAARDYYRGLLGELDAKVAAGEAAIPGERRRIFWDGMPIWGRLRSTSELFKRNRTAVVASTYCNSWVFPDLDPDDPFRSTARATLSIFINRNDAFKEKYLLEAASEFGVDGIVFHEAKTCPNNSNTQYNLPGRLRAAGLRSATIHGDLCDLRCYSEEQSTTVVEAFLETL